MAGGHPRRRAGGPGEPPHRLADPGSAPKSPDPPPWPSRGPRRCRCPGHRSAGCRPAGSAPWSCRCPPPPAAGGVPRWSWPLDAAWGSAGPDPGRSPLSGRSHTVVQSQSYCSPFSLFSQTDLYFTAKSGRGQRRNRRFFRIRFVIKLRLTFVYLFATLMV